MHRPASSFIHSANIYFVLLRCTRQRPARVGVSMSLAQEEREGTCFDNYNIIQSSEWQAVKPWVHRRLLHKREAYVELWNKVEDELERVRLEPSDQAGGWGSSLHQSKDCDGNGKQWREMAEIKMKETHWWLRWRAQRRVFGRRLRLVKNESIPGRNSLGRKIKNLVLDLLILRFKWVIQLIIPIKQRGRWDRGERWEIIMLYWVFINHLFN